MKKLMLISLSIICFLLVSLFFLHKYLLSQIYPVPRLMQQKSIANAVLIEVPSDNRTAHGIFIHGDKTLVVLFHGNGSSLHEMLPVSSNLAKEGFSLLLVEYPGYWISSNSTPNESNILYDSKKLIDYISDQYGYSNDKITLFGYSLGGSIAIALAANGIGSKLITVDTFTSMDELISKSLPMALTKIVNTEKYDNMSNAKLVTIPVLLLHGNHDNYIAYEMSERLSKQFVNAKLIPIESDDHASVLRDISDEIWLRIIDFIKS